MKNYFKENPELVSNIRQGVERECLRSLTDGAASLEPHAKALGSKLTHPFITTDYAENLLEYIGGVHSSTDKLLEELEALHAYTVENSNGEILWPSSMPCLLPEEDKIPIACYGKSNTGKLKSLYRLGLGHRYGRSMQSIAGVHYNFSLTDSFWENLKSKEGSDLKLSEYKSQKYFHIIRNFQRNKWLLMYLFGASPAVDKSFLEGKDHSLKKLDENTYYSEYGTSLRMGGLGYTSTAQEDINICFEKVETYIKTLEAARQKSFPEYEKIGLKDETGYKQLNTNLLQIDNEFYSNIRPKNIAGRKESALKSLHLRGVEYIEVRLLDVNPFEKLAFDKDQIHFLHLFLLWCLSTEAKGITKEECSELNENFQKVILEGRRPGLKLERDGKEVSIGDYATSLLDDISDFSSEIRSLNSKYDKALDTQVNKVKSPELLPSARILNELKNKSYLEFHLDLAKDYASSYKMTNEWNEKLIFEGKKSWIKQKEIEDTDTLDFDTYLKNYFEDIKI